MAVQADGRDLGADALLVAIDANGVEFAIPAEGSQAIAQRERIDSKAYPTFTDAIMHYAGRHGIRLQGCRLYVSVAGALNGGTVRVTNGNWFVSLHGLSALTGSAPHVVNDVTAMAYETLEDLRVTSLGPAMTQAESRTPRHVVIYAGTGLGAACVDRHGDRPRILDSEAEHIPFAPATEREWQLLKTLGSATGAASYEQVVTHLNRTDAAQSAELADDTWLASILGRYCVAVTLAYAAWGGAYLCGPVFDRIVKRGGTEALRSPFHERGKMRSILMEVPTWLMSNRTDAIAGLRDVYTAHRRQHAG